MMIMVMSVMNKRMHEWMKVTTDSESGVIGYRIACDGSWRRNFTFAKTRSSHHSRQKMTSPNQPRVKMPFGTVFRTKSCSKKKKIEKKKTQIQLTSGVKIDYFEKWWLNLLDIFFFVFDATKVRCSTKLAGSKVKGEEKRKRRRRSKKKTKIDSLLFLSISISFFSACFPSFDGSSSVGLLFAVYF